jgi:hypothetical protein
VGEVSEERGGGGHVGETHFFMWRNLGSSGFSTCSGAQMSDVKLLDDGACQRSSVGERTYDVTKVFDEEVESRSKQLRS